MSHLRRKLGNVRLSWRAVVMLFREEFSFRLQTLFAFTVIVCSFLFGISRIEFLIILLLIGAVLATEALNTAIEELCDHVTPHEHPSIGKIKDLGSGASLLIGIAALIVGLLIFIPHIF